MYEEIRCTNCTYNDDIMFMEECLNCSLRHSKKEDIIKFKQK